MILEVETFNQFDGCFCVAEYESWESEAFKVSEIGGGERLARMVSTGVGEGTLPDEQQRMRHKDGPSRRSRYSDTHAKVGTCIYILFYSWAK